ncbi:MAG TPA: hypothetical protein VIR29_03150 [Anseongella sp.]
MGVVTIEMEDTDACALLELFSCLRSYNEEMPNDFSIVIQHSLMDSAKAGSLETESAFEVFGHLSRITADIAYSSGLISRFAKVFSAALDDNKTS